LEINKIQVANEDGSRHLPASNAGEELAPHGRQILVVARFTRL